MIVTYIALLEGEEHGYCCRAMLIHPFRKDCAFSYCINTLYYHNRLYYPVSATTVRMDSRCMSAAIDCVMMWYDD